jgi:hypothetical protein
MKTAVHSMALGVMLVMALGVAMVASPQPQIARGQAAVAKADCSQKTDEMVALAVLPDSTDETLNRAAYAMAEACGQKPKGSSVTSGKTLTRSHSTVGGTTP